MSWDQQDCCKYEEQLTYLNMSCVLLLLDQENARLVSGGKKHGVSLISCFTCQCANVSFLSLSHKFYVYLYIRLDIRYYFFTKRLNKNCQLKYLNK